MEASRYTPAAHREYWQTYAQTAIERISFKKLAAAWTLATRLRHAGKSGSVSTTYASNRRSSGRSLKRPSAAALSKKRVRELENLKAQARAKSTQPRRAVNERLTDKAGGAPIPQATAQWWDETAGVINSSGCSKTSLQQGSGSRRGPRGAQAQLSSRADLSTIPLKALRARVRSAEARA